MSDSVGPGCAAARTQACVEHHGSWCCVQASSQRSEKSGVCLAFVVHCCTCEPAAESFVM